MSKEIKLIPQIPPDLSDAAKQGILVPFVGAGVSRLAGSPGWQDFADGVLRNLVGPDQFTYGDIGLLQSLSPRVKLSLASIFSRKFKCDTNYFNLLHENNANRTEITNRLYYSLSKLGKTFVTTNYDEWLDNMITPMPPTVNSIPSNILTSNEKTTMNVVWNKDQFVPSLLEKNTVIHLHGAVKDPESMILTVGDYIRHYANDRINGEENPVLTFLDDLFRIRSVLFIGYGLEEYELLEPIIMKAKAGFDHHSIRHYLLQGFFSYEQRLSEILQNYYRNELGIELLPYRRDEKDREQLVDVLEAFAEQIPAAAPSVLQDLNDMEALL